MLMKNDYTMEIYAPPMVIKTTPRSEQKSPEQAHQHQKRIQKVNNPNQDKQRIRSRSPVRQTERPPSPPTIPCQYCTLCFYKERNRDNHIANKHKKEVRIGKSVEDKIKNIRYHDNSRRQKEEEPMVRHNETQVIQRKAPPPPRNPTPPPPERNNQPPLPKEEQPQQKTVVSTEIIIEEVPKNIQTQQQSTVIPPQSSPTKIEHQDKEDSDEEEYQQMSQSVKINQRIKGHHELLTQQGETQIRVPKTIKLFITIYHNCAAGPQAQLNLEILTTKTVSASAANRYGLVATYLPIRASNNSYNLAQGDITLISLSPKQNITQSYFGIISQRATEVILQKHEERLTSETFDYDFRDKPFGMQPVSLKSLRGKKERLDHQRQKSLQYLTEASKNSNGTTVYIHQKGESLPTIVMPERFTNKPSFPNFIARSCLSEVTNPSENGSIMVCNNTKYSVTAPTSGGNREDFAPCRMRHAGHLFTVTVEHTTTKRLELLEVIDVQ